MRRILRPQVIVDAILNKTKSEKLALIAGNFFYGEYQDERKPGLAAESTSGFQLPRQRRQPGQHRLAASWRVPERRASW
jgi:hypothetical protein